MGHWTIDELAAQAAAVLAGDDRARTTDARTRGLPDPRTIRWYQTTGLIDRPNTMRGRTALYGERHLAQLIAIKRLQGEGRSLAAIQAQLAGASDDVLRRLARLPTNAAAIPPNDPIPTGLTPTGITRTDPGRPTPERAEAVSVETADDSRGHPTARPRFWTASPAPVTANASAGTGPTDDGPTDDGDARIDTPTRHPDDHPASSTVIHGLRLAPGVVLLVEGGRAPSRADTEAVRRAAGPLLDELTSRALLEEQR